MKSVRDVLLPLCVGALLICSLLWVTPVGATTIFITDGYLDMQGSSGTLNLLGERGFSLPGQVDIWGGVWAPWRGPFRPGEWIDLFGWWSGSDLSDDYATLDGVTYDMHYGRCIATSGCNLGDADVKFFGGVLAPLEIDSSPVVVETLFVMAGTFRGYPLFREGLPQITESLAGYGLATVWLIPGEVSAGNPIWSVSSVLYEFQSPVPEPSTLVLLTSGLAGLGGMAWRRHRQG